MGRLKNSRIASKRARGVKLVFMENSTLDVKLEAGQARAVQAMSFSSPENPFYQSLEAEEQRVWALYRTGIKQRRIGIILGLNEQEVCRILKAIRKHLVFMARFRKILLGSSGYIDAFLMGEHCSRSNCLAECGACAHVNTCKAKRSIVEAKRHGIK